MQPYRHPLREATVHHSIEGRFAIRQGPWKLILWPGSGGWSVPTTKELTSSLPRYQLYNLATDPAETRNLAASEPSRVTALKALLTRYIREGRSTPGLPQTKSVWRRGRRLARSPTTKLTTAGRSGVYRTSCLVYYTVYSLFYPFLKISLSN